MSARPHHEVPDLHVRAPRRVVGVGGEAEPLAGIVGNRAGLVALRDLIDEALRVDEGMAVLGYGYREADERRFDVTVQRADRGIQMGEPREPERPDYSVFA